ncbi:MAG: sulfite exporter TauE/SafE family protein [Acidobacteriia bacterium]|nr:sulfite exporter TauE/SafE family protein [Terriglobia bacterium]
MSAGPVTWLLILIGLVSGLASGLFGIGGGVLVVPALMYLVGFSQKLANGTSLAILLPPVGLGAVIEYYRQGHVNLRAALIVAVALFVGGYFGALLANRVSGPHLRLLFGVFVLGVGCYLVFDAARRLGWV